MLKYWQIRDCGTRFQAEIVSYADDFVILSRGMAEPALEWAKECLGRIHLVLNEKKTSLRDARKETFDFLGYSFGPIQVLEDRAGIHKRQPFCEEC